jgi:hypothetical protein
VKQDLLSGQRCFRGGHPVTRGDQPAQRLGRYEQLLRDPDAGWMIVLMVVVCCMLCDAIWPVAASAIPVGDAQVKEWVSARHWTLGLVG